MKTEKINLTKLIKIGILFFGISLLLWNCEKDEFITIENKKIDKHKIIDKNYFEFKNEIKFQKAIRVINDSKTKKNKKLLSKNSNDIYNFTIDSSKIRKIEKDSITSFTFFVKRDKVDSKFFENLVVEFKLNEKPKAFIIKYKPIKKIKFFKEHNSFDFQGNIEINRIDYNRLNLSAKMVCYTTEIVYCTLTGWDNYLGYYHYGTHVASPDCYNYAESNRFSIQKSNCITIDGGDWGNDGYSGGGSTGGGGGDSGPSNPDEEEDIVTSPLNYPCGDPIHGCSRIANKLASTLNLSENERLWLNKQNETVILNYDQILDEENSISTSNFLNSVISIFSNYYLSEQEKLENFTSAYNNFDPILDITNQNDFDTKIKSYINYFKRRGNHEFANYLESLLPLDSNFSNEDYQKLYETIREQKLNYFYELLKEIGIATFDAFKPVIEMALWEVGGGVALKVLSKLPIKYLTTPIKNIIARLKAPTSTAFSKLKHAKKYGIQSYKQLAKEFEQLGLKLSKEGVERHHLIEVRFFNENPNIRAQLQSKFGANTDDWLSIIVDKGKVGSEHWKFSQEWIKAIGKEGKNGAPGIPGWTNKTTSNATLDDVIKAAREIYKDYPEILKALGL